MGLFDFLKPPEQTKRTTSDGVWEKLLDANTGKDYFWNRETGETTWENPNTSQTAKLEVNRFREISRDVRQTEDLPFPVDLLGGTYLEGRRLSRIYRASRDGWSASKFHALCDNKGPCVVYCETQEGNRFGAFNPDGWCSDDDYRYNLNTFLFFWPEQDGATPVKLLKVGGGDTALFDYARSGPHFGADGLIIGAGQAVVTGLFAGPDFSDNDKTQGQLKNVVSRLGQSYARIPKQFGQASMLGGDRESAVLAELEVYAAPELF